AAGRTGCGIRAAPGRGTRGACGRASWPKPSRARARALEADAQAPRDQVVLEPLGGERVAACALEPGLRSHGLRHAIADDRLIAADAVVPRPCHGRARRDVAETKRLGTRREPRALRQRPARLDVAGARVEVAREDRLPAAVRTLAAQLERPARELRVHHERRL